MSDRYIVIAVQRGNSVQVEYKNYNSTQGGSFSRPGELVSFSENMVCVKNGNKYITYDANNKEIASRYA